MAGPPGPESARRAIDLLFAFERKAVASVRTLAELTDLPVPSAHRYVAMLKDMGLVEEARHGEYRLTLRVASLGQAARRATSLVETVQPFMQSLREETGETVLLIQEIGGVPVCIYRVDSQRRIRLSFETGQPLPALRGASAHLLIAAITPDRRLEHVEKMIDQGAAPPVSGLDVFMAEVERDASRGWAVSTEEIDEGIWSAAAMIHQNGKFFGTLSVPCPLFRVNDESATGIIEAVRKSAAQISTALSAGA